MDIEATASGEDSCTTYGHTWVAGLMYVSDEDVVEVAKVRRVECERCGEVAK